MTFSPNNDDRLWKDEKSSKGWFRFSSPLHYLVFLLILILIVVGAWYLLTPARQNYNAKNLALIRADDSPYKVKAEEQAIPGIKHQDKLVYSRIRSDENAPPVEHILPDPEPIFVSNTSEPTALKMEEFYSPDEFPLEAMAVQEEKPVHVASIEELIDDVPEEASLPTPSSKGNNVLIQLGSLKSHDLAQDEWKRLVTKNKDILGGLDPIIQKVDLGAEKGIFYRLRTGVTTQASAKQVCSTLKERKVECVVVH